MDWEPTKFEIWESIKKYRYVLLILLVGIILMLLPDKKVTEPEYIQETVHQEESTLEDSLSKILSKISGAGDCAVLLTQESGEEILYQTDQAMSNSDHRSDTVMVTDSNREETGLIRQINSPVYRGAIILCQGAENASVRLSIVEAVASVTGLTSDRITVLKMK